MDDNNLKEQLADLFIGLKDFNNKVEPASLIADAPDLPADQLERLFSDAATDSPASISVPEAKVAKTKRVKKTTETQEQRPTPKPAAPAPAPPVKRPIEQVIADAGPHAVEERLLHLLTSKSQENRQLAVEQLARIQSQWVIDPLLRAVSDSHPAVAGLALAALLQMDTEVKQRLLTLAAETLPPLLQKSSEIYFSHLLAQPFVYIPAGPFLMGSPAVDPVAEKNEQPQHALHLGSYWIGRYPVTAAQFKAFIQKTGHRPRGNEYKHQPDNHPIIDVTWHEALAYCGWLKERSGLPVMLPSEAQWEKAARGTDGRRYPWGDTGPTEALCNFHHSTPVGAFSPQGDSPFGCADMAGNVWEWTRSIYQPYPYNAQDGRERLTGDKLRVIRGLTFNNVERFTRCAFRYKLAPELHLRHLGFRVAISPDRHSEK